MNGKINVKVVLHREGKGYWVEVPSLPGCYSQGGSKQDALRNIKEALLLHHDTDILEEFSKFQ